MEGYCKLYAINFWKERTITTMKKFMKENGTWEGNTEKVRNYLIDSTVGVQLYRNGDKYDGDWHSGFRHGNGTIQAFISIFSYISSR